MLIKTLINVLQVVLFGSLIGSIVSLFTLAFVYGVKYISSLRQSVNNCFITDSVACFSFSPLIFLLFAAIVITLVKKYFGISRYHGPADVILSAHSPKEELNPKVGVLSTLAAFISASGGASVGQYGPLVHLGGTIGNFLSSNMQKVLTKDVFIGCGVAAAISAGFNSPIGGIIFAHEAILRHFSFRAIAPIAIASVASATLTNYFFPLGILFQNTNSNITLFPSVTMSLFLGPICAIIAVIFMKSLLFLQKHSTKVSNNDFIRILIASLLCGILGGFVPEILGLGGETIEKILNNSLSLKFLVLILILKLFVTVICLSLGFFGGVFSPALVLGASIGAIFSYFGYFIGLDTMGDSLVLAGMAALSASVIGAPIASIVIIFELTQSYDLAFVAIICVAGSCLVSSAIFGHSFFDKQLLNRNFKISRGRTEILLTEVKIESVMRKNKYLAVSVAIDKSDLLHLFKKTDFTEAYFLDENGKLLGKTKVNYVLSSKSKNIIQEKSPLYIEKSSTVADAIVKASNFVGESIPITDQIGKLVGVVTESDLFLEYIKVQNQISEIEKD